MSKNQYVIYFIFIFLFACTNVQPNVTLSLSSLSNGSTTINANDKIAVVAMSGAAVDLYPLLQDSDAGGGAVQLNYVSTATLGYVNNWDGVTGRITYTPPVSQSGIDSFSYTVKNSKGSSKSVKITVNVMTPYTWTGLGGNSNWSNVNNWCGTVSSPGFSGTCGSGAIPTAAATAVFDGTCTNCNANIDTNVNFGTLEMQSSYVGTITQQPTKTMAMTTGGWKMAGGNFVGGNAAINVTGTFDISSGSFKAPFAYLTLYTTSSNISPATFDNNGGMVEFYSSNSNITIANNVHFYDVNLFMTGGPSNFNGSTFYVDRNLNLNGAGTSIANNGTLYLGGNLTASGTHGMPGSLSIEMIGATPATINGASGAYIPNLNINKTGAGGIDLSGVVYLYGDFIYTTASYFHENSSTVELHNSVLKPVVFKPNGITFNNLTFSGVGDATNYIDMGGQIANVSGTLTLNGSSPLTYVNNGTLNATGNVTTSGNGIVGNSTVIVGGTTAVAQNINGASGAYFPNLTINHTGTGGVYLSGTIQVFASYYWITGPMYPGTSTLLFASISSGAISINPGPVSYYNVNFSSSAGTSYHIYNNDLTVTNTSTFTNCSLYLDGRNMTVNTASLNLNSNTLYKVGGALYVNSTLQGTGSLFSGTVNP